MIILSELTKIFTTAPKHEPNTQNNLEHNRPKTTKCLIFICLRCFLNTGRSLSSRSHSACERSVSGHLPAFCSRLIAELLMLSIATCMTLKVRGRECFHTFSVHLLQTMGGKKKKKGTVNIVHSAWIPVGAVCLATNREWRT